MSDPTTPSEASSTIDPTVDRLVDDLIQDPVDSADPSLAEENPSSVEQVPNTFNHLDEKKSPKRFLKYGCIGLVILGLCALVGGVGASFLYLRDHTVPYVSPLVEDIYSSPADQLSQKMGFTADVIALNVINEAGAADIDIDTDITEDDFDYFVKIAEEEMSKVESFEYNVGGSFSYDLKNPILGASDEAGSLDDQDIETIISSTKGTVEFATNAKLQRNDEQLLGGEAESYLAIEVPGVNAATEFEVVVDDKDIFFMLNYFPENPWVKTELIEGDWIRFDMEDTGIDTSIFDFYGIKSDLSYQDSYGTSPYSGMEYNKEDHDNLKKAFRTETFLNNVEAIENRQVGPHDSKCYRLSFTEDELYQYIYEVSEIYDPGSMTLDEIQAESDDYISINKFDLDICFATDTNMPVYGAFSIDVGLTDDIVDGGGDIGLFLEYSQFDLSNYTVVAPNNSIDYDKVDWEALLEGTEGFMGMSSSPSFGSAGNAKREADVAAVNSAIAKYIILDLSGDLAGLQDGCKITTLPELNPVDGIEVTEGGPLGDLQTCLGGYISQMPTAPGVSVYRWGVDDVNSPYTVYVGVDSMDEEDGYMPSDYYLEY